MGTPFLHIGVTVQKFLALFEIRSPYILLGCIERDYSIRAKRIPMGQHTTGAMMTDFTHEQLGLDGDFNWRYRPDTATLFWWTPPVDEDYTDAVKAYVTKATGVAPLKSTSMDGQRLIALDGHGHDRNKPFVPDAFD